jgi:hypothetical protein
MLEISAIELVAGLPLSSWLLGIDKAGARDGFLCGHCLTLLCLIAKPSHVGADVDELARRLYYPTDCG